MNDTLSRALKISIEYGITGASLLQRKMLIPYDHAAELLRVMAKRGYIEPISERCYKTVIGWLDLNK